VKRPLEVSKDGLLLGAKPLRAGVNFIKSGKATEQGKKRKERERERGGGREGERERERERGREREREEGAPSARRNE